MWAIFGSGLVIFAGGAFGLIYSLTQSAIVLFSTNNNTSLFEGLVLFPKDIYRESEKSYVNAHHKNLFHFTL